MTYLVVAKRADGTGGWADIQGRAVVFTTREMAQKFLDTHTAKGTLPHGGRIEQYGKNPLTDRYLLIDAAGKVSEAK